MFDSAILDVAIGLALIFLMVSLLVSAAAEALAGWFKWRSTHLWQGLEQLLQSADARDELYNHPLVKGLARVDVRVPHWNGGRNGPSYIPSRTFALAVIDILRQPHRFVDELQGRLQALVDRATADPTIVFEALKAFVDESSAAAIPDSAKGSLRDLWDRVNPQIDPAAVATLTQQVRGVLARLPQDDRDAVAGTVSTWIDQAGTATSYISLRAALAEAIGNIPFRTAGSPAEQATAELKSILDQFKFGNPDEALREMRSFLKQQPSRWLQDANSSLTGTIAALTPLMHDAAEDVDRFRENIEIWFNDGMDRVSGWYKRHIGYVQAVIAFALAAVMNIDALLITRTLWREPTLRRTLVAQAEAVVASPPPALQYPPQETSAQPSAGPGNDLTVRLSTVRIEPPQVATARVSIPEGATDQDVIHVEREGSYLLLGETANNISSTRIEKKLAPGATDVEIYMSAHPVAADSRERFAVTFRDQRVTPEVVVGATADQNFADVQRQIGALGLPIGWTCPADIAVEGEPPTNVGGPFWCAGATPAGRSGRTWLSASWWFAVGLKNLLAMLIGWLITAAATSLGAPFWFDMLKRVVSIRSSGKAPEERPLSPKEVPQPREPGQRPKEADLVNALKR